MKIKKREYNITKMIGRKICDFAPNKENNRNSEGDFLRLKDGSIIFIYSRYGAAGFEGDVHSMLERTRITKISIDELCTTYDKSKYEVKR